MFYYQTFFSLQICSSLNCSQQIPEKEIGGHRARLREKENLFRYRAQFEGNLLRFARARAHVRTLMMQTSCAVGMRNAILRNYLKKNNNSSEQIEIIEDDWGKLSHLHENALKKEFGITKKQTQSCDPHEELAMK